LPGKFAKTTPPGEKIRMPGLILLESTHILRNFHKKCFSKKLTGPYWRNIIKDRGAYSAGGIDRRDKIIVFGGFL
jgi:hypothetical protein